MLFYLIGAILFLTLLSIIINVFKTYYNELTEEEKEAIAKAIRDNINNGTSSHSI
jgi:hypothetical protein